MSTPLVQCIGCTRAWHSTTMVDGLRQIGSCPRCGAELAFADAAPTEITDEQLSEPTAPGPPHLVLGVPRR